LSRLIRNAPSSFCPNCPPAQPLCDYFDFIDLPDGDIGIATGE
jgi:hypothetical protein